VLVADDVERRRDRAAGLERGEADAAVADDHRRHALRQLGLHRVAVEGQRVVMGMDVDETGRQSEAGTVEALRGGRSAQFPDSGDTVAIDRHVADNAVAAGSVDDSDTTKKKIVVSGIEAHLSSPLWPRCGRSVPSPGRQGNSGRVLPQAT